MLESNRGHPEKLYYAKGVFKLCGAAIVKHQSRSRGGDMCHTNGVQEIILSIVQSTSLCRACIRKNLVAGRLIYGCREPGCRLVGLQKKNKKMLT